MLSKTQWHKVLECNKVQTARKLIPEAHWFSLPNRDKPERLTACVLLLDLLVTFSFCIPEILIREAKDCLASFGEEDNLYVDQSYCRCDGLHLGASSLFAVQQACQIRKFLIGSRSEPWRCYFPQCRDLWLCFQHLSLHIADNQSGPCQSALIQQPESNASRSCQNKKSLPIANLRIAAVEALACSKIGLYLDVVCIDLVAILVTDQLVLKA